MIQNIRRPLKALRLHSLADRAPTFPRVRSRTGSAQKMRGARQLRHAPVRLIADGLPEAGRVGGNRATAFRLLEMRSDEPLRQKLGQGAVPTARDRAIGTRSGIAQTTGPLIDARNLSESEH